MPPTGWGGGPGRARPQACAGWSTASRAAPVGQLTLARRGDTVVGPGCAAEVVEDPGEGRARLLAQVGEQIENISA
ncbi:hypothetical protein [Streptomyces sp. NPDC001508]|uniref:hypothetical protein n=1 Tax=Streptomyces sp. NPDC001508 TaxID=3154656 RepID=UPI00332485A5